MDIDRVTLVGPNGGCRSLSEVTVRAATIADRSLVFEVPRRPCEQPTENRPPDHPTENEAGWSIVLTTNAGVTYSGYVETVVNASDARFYWCAVDR